VTDFVQTPHSVGTRGELPKTVENPEDVFQNSKKNPPRNQQPFDAGKKYLIDLPVFASATLHNTSHIHM